MILFPVPKKKNKFCRPNLLLIVSLHVNTNQQTHLHTVLHDDLGFMW